MKQVQKLAFVLNDLIDLVQAILYKKDPEQKKDRVAKPETVNNTRYMYPGDKASEETHSAPEHSGQVDITAPEGVAKLSVRGTFPETIEKLCSACEHKGTEWEATNKCIECQELLCEFCKDLLWNATTGTLC